MDLFPVNNILWAGVIIHDIHWTSIVLTRLNRSLARDHIQIYQANERISILVTLSILDGIVVLYFWNKN